eukprot:g211.t1
MRTHQSRRLLYNGKGVRYNSLRSAQRYWLLTTIRTGSSSTAWRHESPESQWCTTVRKQYFHNISHNFEPNFAYAYHTNNDEKETIVYSRKRQRSILRHFPEYDRLLRTQQSWPALTLVPGALNQGARPGSGLAMAQALASSRRFYSTPTQQSAKDTTPPSTTKDGKAESSTTAVSTEVKKTLWQRVKEEAIHYYNGFRLFFKELGLASNILWRMAQGHNIKRRERRQLLRSSTDIVRVVPFSMFIIIPFMEFLLPIALKLFPGMLPSTFTTKLKREEEMQKQLQIRLEMASFMKEMVDEMAKTRRKKELEKLERSTKQGEDGTSIEDAKAKDAEAIIELVDSLREGENLDNDDFLKVAKLFGDDLTLDNISRMQLVTICRFMGILPFGGDGMLRVQIRRKVRELKEDDRMILWEGVDSLTTSELQVACNERGMRGTGLSEYQLRQALEQWLDLSLNKKIPMTLLILSRAFTITQPVPTLDMTAAIKDTVASLEEEVVTEAVLEEVGDDRTPAVTALKLESLEMQKSKITEEREEEEERLREEKLEEKAEKEAAERVDTELDQLDTQNNEKLEARNVLEEEAKLEMMTPEVKEDEQQLEVARAKQELVKLLDEEHGNDTLSDPTLDVLISGQPGEGDTFDPEPAPWSASQTSAQGLERVLSQRDLIYDQPKDEEFTNVDQYGTSSPQVGSSSKGSSATQQQSETQTSTTSKSSSAPTSAALIDDLRLIANADLTIEQIDALQRLMTSVSPMEKERSKLDNILADVRKDAQKVEIGLKREQELKEMDATLSTTEKEDISQEEPSKSTFSKLPSMPSMPQIVGSSTSPTSTAKTEKAILDRIDLMLTNLQGEIDQADEKMKDRFALLDADGDGRIERDELVNAIMTEFRETHTRQEAIVIATKLDP